MSTPLDPGLQTSTARRKGWLRRSSGRLRDACIPAAFGLGMLLIWELAVKLLALEVWFLPAPSDIIASLVRTRELLFFHSLVTVGEAAVGFVAAILLAFVLALVMDTSPFIKKALYPLLVASQTVPIIAIAPLMLIWFGHGILPKIVVVGLVCFFPVVVSTADGLAAADPEMVSLLQVMGAGSWQIFRLVRFPAALPYIFAGLKIAATYSIMGAVIGEWLMAQRGLGLFMIRSYHSFLTAQLFAAIVVVTVLSILLFGFIEVLARNLMPWHYAISESPVWEEKGGE